MVAPCLADNWQIILSHRLVSPWTMMTEEVQGGVGQADGRSGWATRVGGRGGEGEEKMRLFSPSPPGGGGGKASQSETLACHKCFRGCCALASLLCQHIASAPEQSHCRTCRGDSA